MASVLAAGTLIAGYRIEGVVGRGGMGVVYSATQLALRRRVALKVIAPALAGDEAFRERFRRESQLAATIDHPNVVPIHEAGEAGGLLFLAMRYVEGDSLAARLHREGRLAPSQAAALLGQIASALDAAHGLGLVHRDVKPANVLLGPGDHAYLTDFGLVRQLASGGSITRSGQWLGTLSYAAPEQIQGERVDGRADVYALGCVLFQCLCGQVPFERDSDMARMWAHTAEPPPVPSTLVPELPPGFDDVVARALAKDPDERQGSAGELGHELAAACSGSALEQERTAPATQLLSEPPATRVAGEPPATRVAGEPPPFESAPAKRRRRPIALVAAAALVLAVAAVLVATQVLPGGGGGGAERRAAAAAAQQAEQAAADERRRERKARERARTRDAERAKSEEQEPPAAAEPTPEPAPEPSPEPAPEPDPEPAPEPPSTGAPSGQEGSSCPPGEVRAPPTPGSDGCTNDPVSYCGSNDIPLSDCPYRTECPPGQVSQGRGGASGRLICGPPE